MVYISSTAFNILQVLIPNTQELSDIRLRFILDRCSYYNHPRINLVLREICKKNEVFGYKRNKRILKEWVEFQAYRFIYTEIQ